MPRLENYSLNVPSDGNAGAALRADGLKEKYVQLDAAIAAGSLIIEGKLRDASSWATLATLDDTTTGIAEITVGVAEVRVRNDGVANPPAVHLAGWTA